MDWYGFSVVTKTSSSKNKPEGKDKCSQKKGKFENGGTEKGERNCHVILLVCVCVLLWQEVVLQLIFCCSDLM